MEELAKSDRHRSEKRGQGIDSNATLSALQAPYVGPVNSGKMAQSFLRSDASTKTQLSEAVPDGPAQYAVLVGTHAATSVLTVHRSSDSIEVARYL